jgi:DNA-binding beta-propeller fold protein YncE
MFKDFQLRNVVRPLRKGCARELSAGAHTGGLMANNRISYLVVAVLVICGVVLGEAVAGPEPTTPVAPAGVPVYEVDPSWPKTKGNWILGSIGGITVDPQTDHVWVVQRPSTLDEDENYAARVPPLADCCVPAPPVMEIDEAGNLIQGWGGPGPGWDWPNREHGITIDYEGNVWILGSGTNDNQILKFTKAGKFLMQVGHPGKSKGSTDTANFNQPTKAWVYPKTKEVFVSDGYQNRRIIVLDAETGAFKRLWGAYGKQPDDSIPQVRVFSGPGPAQFNLVHCVVISNDDLVYVADRSNNRIQVFRPDGAFVKEAFVAREIRTPTGTAMDLALSPDARQQFLYVSGGDQHIRILNRETLQVVSTIGRLGHYPGQFYHLHVLAVDSKGNLYTGESSGKRIQKFVFKGFSSPGN